MRSSKRLLRPFHLLPLLAACGLMQASAKEVLVTAFGAKGDGKKLDTAAIQAAIDHCAASGGGLVRLPPGRYLSGSLQLRSGIGFHLEKGATLLGSTSMDDYPKGVLLFAKESKDIVIEGEGEIDAQGKSFWVYDKPYAGPPWRGTAQFEYRALRRPHCLQFRSCENLTVRGITIRNSPSWTVHFLRCAKVKVERITIRNPLYGPNADGIDINSCRDVQVEACDLVTADDGIVLKSTEPGRDHPSSNITVAGCRIMSACNALKIGTETHSDFENVLFRDCELYSSSERPLDRALSGLAIESVDGSNLRNIRAENLTMSNLRTPIFVRLGHRGGNSEKTRQAEPRIPGTIRDVVIRKVRAKHMMFESSITGIPGHPVENILLEDIQVTYEGGGGRELIDIDVPDREVIAKYPEAQMFGRLPAYGLYFRHVAGLTLRNVEFAVEQPDARPPFALEDVNKPLMECVQAATAAGQPVFAFREVKGARVQKCAAPAGASSLVRATGEIAAGNEVHLEDNLLPEGAKEFLFQTPRDALAGLPLFEESPAGIVEISGTGMVTAAPMRVVENAHAPEKAALLVPLDGGRDIGTARARFKIREPGTYVIRVLALAPSSESDSFHLGVDGAPPQLTDLRVSPEWTWDFVRDRRDGKTDSRARSEFTLAAGEHLLTLRNREAGTQIARIAIVRLDQLEEFVASHR